MPEQMAGVFKSTNGGASWTAANSGMGSIYVYSLAIDPTNSQTVYAGTWGGVFKSTNGGASWTAANSGMTIDQVISSLAIDPTNSQTVYARAFTVESGSDSGKVFKSTNGGASWTAASSGMPKTGMTFPRHRPDQQPDDVCRDRDVWQ